MVDVAIAQSVDWGGALGAGRPRLALQMISEMFRARWDSDQPPNVKLFVEGSRDRWSAAASPGDAVRPSQFGEHGSTISWQEFNDPKWRPIMEQWVFHALLWGLS